jgi:hypothetical protein
VSVAVSYSPKGIAFGAVLPDSEGPDVTVYPPLPPDTPSFNGGVLISSVPVGANVRARISGDDTRFSVRDVIALAWKMRTVDPSELPPNWHGPLPKVRVLEQVGQSDGVRPLPVAAGQSALVRVEYYTYVLDPAEDTYSATLMIDGDEWNPIQLPVSLFVAEVTTDVPANPLVIARGRSADLPIRVTLLIGPETDVSYELSGTQLHSGLTLAPAQVHVAPGQPSLSILTFQAATDAPLGPNDIAIDQIAFGKRSGFFAHVNVVDQSAAPQMDARILWELATPLGILRDEQRDAWNAGRTHDAIPLPSGSLLLGTSNGGVWAVTETGEGISHSHDWENVEVLCLARGLDDPNHFYAGCGAAGALFESEPATAFLDYMSWHRVPIVDRRLDTLDTRTVWKVEVVAAARKLVLACDKGVFWAEIPPIGGTYFFSQVGGSLPAGRYCSAASGPAGSVLVGALGDGGAFSGIFLGEWSSGDLVFSRMIVPGGERMVWTTLAACDSDLNRVYAAGSDTNENLVGIWRYDHRAGDKQWIPCTTAAEGAPAGKNVLNSTGDQSFGGWVKTLRVAPGNPDVVSIHWGRSFLSTSGGRDAWIGVDVVPPQDPDATDWDRPPGFDVHGHEDGHATVFDPHDPNPGDPTILYIVSDGGVVKTPDRSQTWVSRYNRRLANLMFEGPPTRRGSYNYGTSALSPTTLWPATLVAGGLQDNSDIYCELDPGLGPWQELSGGDGRTTLFLPSGELIWDTNGLEAVRVSRWDGSQFSNTETIPGTGGDAPNEGLIRPIANVVTLPESRDAQSGNLMVALATADDGRIHGLFADDAGNVAWQPSLASLPADAAGKATAITSLHGDRLWAGTNDGRIFVILSATGEIVEFETPHAATPGSVDRILVLPDESAYAAYNTGGGQGLLLQQHGFAWDPLGANQYVAAGNGLPGGLIYALTADTATNPPTLFLAADNLVYISRDKADTWELAGWGLPRQAQCVDLHVASHSNGRRYLYLTTFGHSVWRALLS